MMPQDGGIYGSEDFSLRALLGDFGETVKLSQAEAEAPRQHGTLEWMAPEIMLNEGNATTGSTYTEASDCYSLTVVLWECLTRQKPYADLVSAEDLSMFDLRL